MVLVLLTGPPPTAKPSLRFYRLTLTHS